MSTPEVSVVVPFLDAGPFIAESVASVRAQTDPRWELLLVDDGSRDESRNIARGAAEQDPGRVRYLEQPGRARRGASAARNLAIRQARGRYIAFLDADDVWLPDKLEAQLAIAAAHPEAAMIYNRTQYWYSWTGAEADRDRDFIESLGVASNTLVEAPRLLTMILRGQSPSPCTCSVLIRREAVEQVGGFEERFVDLFTDQSFYAKVLLAMPVFAADGCWDRYRQHPAQSCATAERTGRIRVARGAFLAWLGDYLAAHASGDGEVRKALEAALDVHREGAEPAITPAALAKRAVRYAVRWLPEPARDRLRRRWRGASYVPPVGRVDFGDLRRTRPISSEWGLDRGYPVDRYYIDGFLARHAKDIQGHVLEIGDDRYTRKFGGLNVTSSDVLNVEAGHPQTTLVADLARPADVPEGCFDCVIVTQTLQLIADLPSCIRTLHRALRPGGVVLATLPGISQTHFADWGAHWRWSFTGLSARTLFETAFAPAEILVETRGNVLAATAFLQGLASRDLQPEELDHFDRDYQVSILVRARKTPAAR
jgi:glycosyltransferase involved in cell wall biosynthesis